MGSIAAYAYVTTTGGTEVAAPLPTKVVAPLPTEVSAPLSTTTRDVVLHLRASPSSPADHPPVFTFVTIPPWRSYMAAEQYTIKTFLHHPCLSPPRGPVSDYH